MQLLLIAAEQTRRGVRPGAARKPVAGGAAEHGTAPGQQRTLHESEKRTGGVQKRRSRCRQSRDGSEDHDECQLEPPYMAYVIRGGGEPFLREVAKLPGDHGEYREEEKRKREPHPVGRTERFRLASGHGGRHAAVQMQGPCEHEACDPTSLVARCFRRHQCPFYSSRTASGTRAFARAARATRVSVSDSAVGSFFARRVERADAMALTRTEGRRS